MQDSGCLEMGKGGGHAPGCGSGLGSEEIGVAEACGGLPPAAEESVGMGEDSGAVAGGQRAPRCPGPGTCGPLRGDVDWPRG